MSGPPEMTSILLNGRGNCPEDTTVRSIAKFEGTFDCTGMEQNCTKAPDMYEQVVQRVTVTTASSKRAY